MPSTITWRIPEPIDLEGKQVRVYRNLHKHTFSIKHKGRIVGYSNAISLKDAKFKVSEASRKRSLRKRQKNVHAYVEGIFQTQRLKNLHTPCSYYPYLFPTFFIRKTRQPLFEAAACRINNSNIFI